MSGRNITATLEMLNPELRPTESDGLSRTTPPILECPLKGRVVCDYLDFNLTDCDPCLRRNNYFGGQR